MAGTLSAGGELIAAQADSALHDTGEVEQADVQQTVESQHQPAFRAMGASSLMYTAITAGHKVRPSQQDIKN